MSQRLKYIGAGTTALGCLSLAVPMIVFHLERSTFTDYNRPSSTQFLFRHFGDIAYWHGFFGLVMSCLLVFGGAALYYGRSYGVGILKTAIWLQLIYIILFETAWLISVPQEVNSQFESRVLMIGATIIAVLAGLVVGVFLLLLLRLLEPISK